MRRPVLLGLLGLLATAPPGAALTVDELFGTYVGRAVVETLPAGERELRDIDITIAPHGADGFKISWINVGLVDGRRDVPGVQRHRGEIRFTKAGDRPFYMEAPDYNPFREREELAPMSGDPVHWALLDDGGLHVYGFVVLEDGRYELQHTVRAPTAEGIHLRFERLVDGTLLRVGEGHAVRVEE